MFNVYVKKEYIAEFSKKRYKVYNIQNNKNGYPLFLIYDDNQWKYITAKKFKLK